MEALRKHKSKYQRQCHSCQEPKNSNIRRQSVHYNLLAEFFSAFFLSDSLMKLADQFVPAVYTWNKKRPQSKYALRPLISQVPKRGFEPPRPLRTLEPESSFSALIQYCCVVATVLFFLYFKWFIGISCCSGIIFLLLKYWQTCYLFVTFLLDQTIGE